MPFNYGNYDSTAQDIVFAESKGYVEPTSETETRKQLSYPFKEIKDYINNTEIPQGGTTGQVLSKNTDDDNDVGWRTAREVPQGGAAWQVLSKTSSTGDNFVWRDVLEVPQGGAAGEVLKKILDDDDSYDWEPIRELPSGGTNNQVLGKTTNGYEWKTINETPSGGAKGQVLMKNSATNYDYSWQNPSDVTIGMTSQSVTFTKSSNTLSLRVLSEAMYDSITKDPNTIYFILEEA